MSRIVGLGLLCLVWAAPAAGQTGPFYVGASTALDTGNRNQVDTGVISTLGGLIGIRVGAGWSVEFEADQGWGEGDPRVFEGLLISQAGPGATAEERERNGIFGRSSHRERAGNGYSANVVWRARDSRRVNVALFGTLSWRRFEARRDVTITRVGPAVTYPPDHPNLQDVAEQRDVIGGGYGAGVMIPVRLTGAITVAPTFRFTAAESRNGWPSG